MWCHLCQKDYDDYEDFKFHILKIHRCSSEFYKDNSDSEDSKKESTGNSEVDENDSPKLNEFSDQEEYPPIPDLGSRKSIKKKTASLKTCGRKSKRIAQRTSPRVKKSVYFKESSDDDMYDLEITNKESEVEDVDMNSSEIPNVQQPFYGMNPVGCAYFPKVNDNTFEFNSINIQIWLLKHKELCKGLKFPLPESLFKILQLVHKKIFEYFCNSCSSNEHTDAVMKVYEEINSMISRHISCVNDGL